LRSVRERRANHGFRHTALPAAIDSCAALQSTPGILPQFLVCPVWCGVWCGQVWSGRTNTGMHHLISHPPGTDACFGSRCLLVSCTSHGAAVSRLRPCLARTRDTVSAWQTAEMSHRSSFQPARVDATRQETTPTSPATALPVQRALRPCAPLEPAPLGSPYPYCPLPLTGHLAKGGQSRIAALFWRLDAIMQMHHRPASSFHAWWLARRPHETGALTRRIKTRRWIGTLNSGRWTVDGRR
jgi:hypothetical protein